MTKMNIHILRCLVVISTVLGQQAVAEPHADSTLTPEAAPAVHEQAAAVVKLLRADQQRQAQKALQVFREQHGWTHQSIDPLMIPGLELVAMQGRVDRSRLKPVMVRVDALLNSIVPAAHPLAPALVTLSNQYKKHSTRISAVTLEEARDMVLGGTGRLIIRSSFAREMLGGQAKEPLHVTVLFRDVGGKERTLRYVIDNKAQNLVRYVWPGDFRVTYKIKDKPGYLVGTGTATAFVREVADPQLERKGLPNSIKYLKENNIITWKMLDHQDADTVRLSIQDAHVVVFSKEVPTHGQLSVAWINQHISRQLPGSKSLDFKRNLYEVALVPVYGGEPANFAISRHVGTDTTKVRVEWDSQADQLLIAAPAEFEKHKLNLKIIKSGNIYVSSVLPAGTRVITLRRIRSLLKPNQRLSAGDSYQVEVYPIGEKGSRVGERATTTLLLNE